MLSIGVALPPSPEYHNNINFNPSIVLLNDNTYLMSFRTFRRWPVLSGNNTREKNHPWYGGPGGEYWWQTREGGYEGTGFALLQIGDRQITSITILPESISHAVDLRLTINENTGEVIGTYKTWVGTNEETTIPLPQGQYGMIVGYDRQKYGLPFNPTSCCVLIRFARLQPMVINQSGVYTLSHSNTKDEILCKNVSDIYEGNWSLWFYYNKLFISYHLVPRHIIFQPDTQMSNCSVITSASETIFSKIQNYYNQAVIISLSTPAIPYNSVYLAVGHSKLFPDKLTSTNTKADIFYRNYRQVFSGHPFADVRYFMFLYTFNPHTLDILQVSDFFLPPTTSSNIVFPCGLTTYPDGYIISYGEHDDTIKLLFVSRNKIETMLQKEKSPAEYDFISL